MKSLDQYDKEIKEAEDRGDHEKARMLEIEKQKRVNVIAFVTHNRHNPR